MSDNEVPAPVYQPGQVVNGHVWTGAEWLAVQPPTSQPAAPVGPKPMSSGRIIAAVVAFVVAAIAAYIGFSWIVGSGELEQQGNQFAGILTLLGLGAFTVAAAFGIAGAVILTRKP